eukprot:GHUV01035384.1.p1 GENE.GHUV01035384.1~~GHUV01035384.1.p1  ORF type:complete len:153 (+),score=4.06 GHUV01035384.1:643-1101(+)
MLPGCLTCRTAHMMATDLQSCAALRAMREAHAVSSLFARAPHIGWCPAGSARYTTGKSQQLLFTVKVASVDEPLIDRLVASPQKRVERGTRAVLNGNKAPSAGQKMQLLASAATWQCRHVGRARKDCFHVSTVSAAALVTYLPHLTACSTGV